MALAARPVPICMVPALPMAPALPVALAPPMGPALPMGPGRHTPRLGGPATDYDSDDDEEEDEEDGDEDEDEDEDDDDIIKYSQHVAKLLAYTFYFT